MECGCKTVQLSGSQTCQYLEPSKVLENREEGICLRRSRKSWTATALSRSTTSLLDSKSPAKTHCFLHLASVTGSSRVPYSLVYSR